MFAFLLAAVRADINRQVGWGREEVRRQARYAVLIGTIIGMAALAALGALTVGLIAIYCWLAPQVGSLAALGIVGAGLLLLMVILLLVAFSLRRPRLKTRPALQVARPAALFSNSTHVSAGEDGALRLASNNLPDGTRSGLLGALALIAIAGVIAGRRMRSE
jgi:hypothetical protein